MVVLLDLHQVMVPTDKILLLLIQISQQSLQTGGGGGAGDNTLGRDGGSGGSGGGNDLTNPWFSNTGHLTVAGGTGYGNQGGTLIIIGGMGGGGGAGQRGSDEMNGTGGTPINPSLNGPGRSILLLELQQHMLLVVVLVHLHQVLIWCAAINWWWKWWCSLGNPGYAGGNGGSGRCYSI